MGWDRRCIYKVTFTPQSKKEVKKLLDLKNIMGTGCRVLKHPDACILCVANNDCDRLPMHLHCRCRPDVYLTIEE